MCRVLVNGNQSAALLGWDADGAFGLQVLFMGDSSSNTGGEDGVEAPEVSSPLSAVLPQEARKNRHEIVKCFRRACYVQESLELALWGTAQRLLATRGVDIHGGSQAGGKELGAVGM